MTAARPPAARRRVTGLLVLGVAGVLFSGCSRGVEVAPPAEAVPECAAVMDALPEMVADQERRPTEPESALTAAWGDPAIIAICGVLPLGPTTQDCLDVSGVDWVVHPLTDGTQFTTFGTTPALQVLVPDAYAPEPLLLPAFGSAARALPPNGRQCR
jgi:uncharacterized protein DUF3515